MKSKYPKLETIQVNEFCRYEIVERGMETLRRNQEKIYALLQEINEKLPKEPKTPKVFYED